MVSEADLKIVLNQMTLKQLVGLLELVADGISERVLMFNSGYADPGLVTRAVMLKQNVEWLRKGVEKRLRARGVPARPPAAAAGDEVERIPR